MDAQDRMRAETESIPSLATLTRCVAWIKHVSPHSVSYYTKTEIDCHHMFALLQERPPDLDLELSVVWSTSGQTWKPYGWDTNTMD